MRKKWWLAAVAMAALCAGLTAGIPALFPPRPGVTKANFDRIEKGMQLEQVEAIFGGPGEDRLLPLADGSVTLRWKAGAYTFAEMRSLDGKVVAMGWYGREETFTDKLRRWLGLPRN